MKIKQRSNHWLGWQPDLPDHRDHLFLMPPGAGQNLPDQVDLRPGFPAPYDQGELGSCTANALAGINQFLRRKQNEPDFTPSRLFIYWFERSMEGTVDSDSGAQIRDGIQVLANQGAPDEALWPYDITQFATKPSDAAMAAALNNQALQYKRINPDIVSMMTCLAGGLPFACGISVYESFESDTVASTGLVPMPGTTEGCMGGHAIVAVGYDRTKKLFLMRNSWGDWGFEHGYFWLPFAYLSSPDLADDRWVISLTE